MSRPVAIDLFCGAGGTSMGLHRAGFDVIGVDIAEQPEYPFRFLQDDALKASSILCGASFVWASPPCQAFTAYKRRKGHVAPRKNLIPQVRQLLEQWGLPYVIENVGGAPLVNPVKLCVSMFGLDVQRHRYFETNFPLAQPGCAHSIWTPRFAPATNRKNLRKTVEVGVWRIALEIQQKAMGIDWMKRETLSQAIPPAYSEFIGRAALKAIRETK